MRKFKIVPCPFGEVLVAARKKRGISQPQLAKLMGRTPQQLAKLEHGKNEPILSTILLIAHILEIEPGELVKETNQLICERLTKIKVLEEEHLH